MSLDPAPEVGYSPEPAPTEPQEPAPVLPGGEKKLGGATGKGFLPGHAPYLRKPGLAGLVKRQTKDGVTLVRLMYRILRGGSFNKQTIVNDDGRSVVIKTHPTIADRIDAAKWFADRGWGKVKEMDENESTRRPFVVLLQGDKLLDPLDEPEDLVGGPIIEHERPALPPPMPEIGFDLNLSDLDDPK